MDNTPNINQFNTPTGNDNFSSTPISTPPTTPPNITNPFTNPTSTSAPKKSTHIGLIIGLATGGVVFVTVIAIIFLFLVGKVDYEATYDALKPLGSSLEDMDYGNCYKLARDLADSYTSVSEYNQYVTGCVTEFSAVESATKEFAKSSGAKRDADIKSDFESFESIFKTIYSKKSELESQLSLYATYHEFYLTIDNADTSNVKNLEQAIISASALFQNTKNSELIAFASGFRERGLAYVQAIDNYQNSSSYSSSLYTEVRTKMNEFTDYIEENAPEIDEISGLDFTKMNDLNDAYYELSRTVHNAYYDHI